MRKVNSLMQTQDIQVSDFLSLTMVRSNFNYSVDHPDKCFYKLSGHIFGVGQFHRPNGKDGGCFAYECQAPATIGAWG